MSTRGAVGIFKGMKWQGVYNHSDSYPQGLGKELWDYLHSSGVNLQYFSRELLNYSDWREYRKGGLCEYCGKIGIGQPCSISGEIYFALSKGKLFPDPEAKKHSHTQEKAPLHSKNAKDDALFIEWAYIVNPEKKTLTVFKGVRSKGFHTESNGERTWQSPNYRYGFVVRLDLGSQEPDWKKIEERGNVVGEIAYEEVVEEVGT